MRGEIQSPIPDNDLRKVYRGTKPTFLKASITTGNINIEHKDSYCLLHLQKSERRFQNCALRYNFLHAALRCSLFRFKAAMLNKSVPVPKGWANLH